uniref:Uncharacterized protein n=1 Tax=Avena sativa TaxID=4498 RepID=A0ACD5UEY0_AVESA
MKTFCSAVGTGTASSEEEESRHFLESGDPAKEAERVTPRGCEVTKTAVGTGSGEAAARELLECGGRVLGYSIPFVLPDETLPRRGYNWLRLLPFLRRDPEPIRSMKALRAQHDAFLRRKTPQSQLRAFNHKIVLQCLEWYNNKHPDDEYEPAPGVVTRRSDYDDNFLWTHGNFLACRKQPSYINIAGRMPVSRKQSGWFPFLPAPRTLFFFELLDINATGVDKVITCTPIGQEITRLPSNFPGSREGNKTDI